MKKIVSIIIVMIVFASVGITAFAGGGGKIADPSGPASPGGGPSSPSALLSRLVAVANSRGAVIDTSPGVYFYSLEDDVFKKFIPMSEAKIVNAADAEDNLSSKDLATFLEQYNNGKVTAKEELGKKLRNAYWYKVPVKYFNNGENYAKFAFTCVGRNVEVTVNGEPMEVVHYTKGTSYFAKVTECGTLLIMSDPD